MGEPSGDSQRRLSTFIIDIDKNGKLYKSGRRFGSADVVSPVNPDTSGAAWPAVSRSVVSCAGPLLQAGTGIVSSSRESLEHVRLDDQISEPLFGQAAADTESMEESTKY